MLMDAGGLFTQLNGGEEKGQKNNLSASAVASSLLIFMAHVSASLLTKLLQEKSATGNLRGDAARISRGIHQIPELLEIQSVPITEAVFFFFFLFSFPFLSASLL